MVHSLKITTCLLGILLISGCVSHYGAATIVSEPAGAEVINAENGRVIGLTPITTSWKDSSSNRQYVALRIKKSGYQPNVSHFWLSMRHKTESAAKDNPQVVNITLEKQ